MTRLGAEEVIGTLMLSGERIVFRSKGTEKIYDPMTIPGFEVIEFISKIEMRGDREADGSAMLLELPSGEKVNLVNATPFEMTRVTNGADTQWAPNQK